MERLQQITKAGGAHKWKQLCKHGGEISPESMRHRPQTPTDQELLKNKSQIGPNARLYFWGGASSNDRTLFER